MNEWRKGTSLVLKIGVGVCALSVLGLLGLRLAGYTIYRNVGPSILAGWYLCDSRTPADLPVPALVRVKPPATVRALLTRFDPTQRQTEFWLKYLVTHPGQRVCLQGDAMTIDGQEVASRPLTRRYDLPVEGCWRLGPEDVFVLGMHPQSLDSRYTGPWPRGLIQGTCTPLWTWEEGD